MPDSADRSAGHQAPGSNLAGVANGVDVAVIDTPNDPSTDQAVVAAAMEAADLLVVPVSPTPLEVERLGPTVAFAAEAGTPMVEVSRQRVTIRDRHAPAGTS